MVDFIKSLELDKFSFGGKLVCVTEQSEVDANIALNCFMWKCFNFENDSVCLVPFHHSYNHYFHCMLKLGCNLKTKENQLNVISSFDGQPEELLCNINQSVDELLQRRVDSPCWLLVDCVSDLLNLNWSQSDVELFLHNLKRLALSDPRLTVVILTQWDDRDQSQMTLKGILNHLSDLRLWFAPISTGVAKDVTGQINVSRRDLSRLPELWSEPRLFHYKCTNRNVKVFLPGNIATIFN